MRASSGLVHFLDNKNSFKLNKLSNNNNNNGGRYSNQSFFNQTLFRKKQINFFHTTSFLQEKPAKKANQSTKEKTVVILGGGISGVSFAYYLLRESLETSKKVKVILIEKNQRVGGWLKTKRTPYGVMEGGAKSMSINTDCLNLLKVIQDVGLNDQLIGAEPLHIPIHLLDKDRLVKLPNNYREILKYPLISTLSKAKMIMKQILFRYSNDEDTSIYDFFRRQTCDSMMKYVIEPESTLEFFGDPREISMKATSRELFDLCNEYGTAYKSAYHFSQLEKGRKMADRYIQTKKAQATALKNFIYELDEEKSAKYSSAYEAAREAVLPLKYHPNHVVIRKGMSFSFRNGMSTLPEAIVQYLLDNFPDQFDIHRRERVIALEINKDEKKVFILTKGAESKRTTIECDYIVSAIPAYELSKLVERQSPKVKRLLNMIPYNPVGVANFAYDHLVDAPFPGSGFIVNDREKRAILSLQFDSQLFKTQNGSDSYSKFSILFGGPIKSDAEKEFLRMVDESEDPTPIFKELAKDYLKVDRDFGAFILHVAPKGAPQYQVGHLDLVEAIQKNLKKEFSIEDKSRLSIIGNSYFGNTVVDLFNDNKKRAIDFAEEFL